MLKRILVLDREFEVPVDGSGRIVSCASPEEVLPILMGGSSAFGNENYMKTGKIRPEILVVDSEFLATYEGLELFEIIRKYYTLRNVAIFIGTNDQALVDPAVLKRYRITGVIAKPYDLASLTAPSFPQDGSFTAPREGSMLASAFIISKIKVKAFFAKLYSFHSAAWYGVKLAGAGKIAAVVTGTAVAVVAVSGSTTGKAHHSVTVQQTQQVKEIKPEVMAAVIVPVQDTTTVAEIVSPPPTPKKKIRSKPIEAPAKAEQAPLVRQLVLPRRDASIKVVAEE